MVLVLIVEVIMTSAFYEAATAMRIGICYKTKEWGVEQLKKLASLIDESMIESATETRVCLKDGSYIIAFPGTDSARGRKLHKIYVQKGVDDDYINTVLRPCIMRMPPLMIECVDDETRQTCFRGI